MSNQEDVALQAEKAYRLRMLNDFEAFALMALRIKTKDARLINFKLNPAQQKIHRIIENQKRKTGKVRVIILKGRQQGCSTYIQGRYYWLSSQRPNLSAYILTHEAEATANLFSMTQRFHKYNLDELRPKTVASSRKELVFDELEGGYSVGTAGSKDTGRSKTIQLFHGSETAFWDNALEHIAGVGQTVGDSVGTEMIEESTGNGVGGYFYEKWQQAVRGEGEYIPIFLTWMMQPEYSDPVKEEFIPTEREGLWIKNKMLSVGNCLWRRRKILQLGGNEEAEKRFMQEYPITPDEAFQSTGGNSLISSDDVLRARSERVADKYGVRVLGVDPACGGGDFTGFAVRQGRKCEKAWRENIPDTMLVAGKVGEVIKEELIDFIFVDGVGIGRGVYDRLCEMGYRDMIMLVNGGSTPRDRVRYMNKRGEMWSDMAEWFKEGGVEIPNNDILHSELIAPFYFTDSRHRQILEKKDDMKKRGIKSPDIGDALAMTFAEPLHFDLKNQEYDDYEEELGRNPIGGY